MELNRNTNSFEICRIIEQITDGQGERSDKLLTLTSWQGGPVVIDLRLWRGAWRQGDFDNMEPGPGVALALDEAIRLRDALQKAIKAILDDIAPEMPDE